MNNKRALGTQYEQQAGKYLETLGYQILEYNYLCKQGEIDVIALDGKTIVFVEVKYRKAKSMVSSLEAVDYKKQRKISKVAQYYLYTKSYLNHSCRFDVIGFDDEKMTHIRNAFDYIG